MRKRSPPKVVLRIESVNTGVCGPVLDIGRRTPVRGVKQAIDASFDRETLVACQCCLLILQR